MLFYLLAPYADLYSIANFFSYITVRSALAGATAFLLCLLLGPMVIRKLRALSIGQEIREEGPRSHQKKAGTPTMGGVLILTAVLFSTLFWANLANPMVWIQIFATVGFGAVGAVDDLSKVLKRRNLGLTAKRKFALLTLVGALVAVAMMYLALQGDFTTKLYLPFFKNIHPEMALLFLPFAMIVLLGSSNAVNLTDGLDGLAIGASGVAFSTYTVIAYLTSHITMANHLAIPHVPLTGELVVYGAAMAGGCMGFLWHNAHPADVFMGDTGALSLGGALGTMALLTTHSVLLVIVGGLFVIEALSVILQVASFKWRKKRIFLMSPIHHHFELKGWHESKVIVRFWMVSILFAILALSTLKLR
ncbi:phospho-N-acetylmuramoyl-pentapeptide-transferase [Acanthopleuribacter pedis]|uniref:Phospho-N-acetylmuramoyl-pentapeptide-transferase n=1 Tax=Acanthopleuribacter pedis TaxID=442870 RepID=A0A8J7U2N4_9BACT|nr:phospho-N-acetylmuramoyl-pentapeptide-transferase [Acanthopleuribacter pedis]MBO1318752.1 phospho-N-acetylmuramoyl-pentapeptide-transferase [Acanthopleuribacter pedis]